LRFIRFRRARLTPQTLGYDGFVANLDALMTDWRNTARLIQALDVVSVDTAVAHLGRRIGQARLYSDDQRKRIGAGTGTAKRRLGTTARG
jgi:hypothetical protein